MAPDDTVRSYEVKLGIIYNSITFNQQPIGFDIGRL